MIYGGQVIKNRNFIYFIACLPPGEETAGKSFLVSKLAAFVARLMKKSQDGRGSRGCLLYLPSADQHRSVNSGHSETVGLTNNN